MSTDSYQECKPYSDGAKKEGQSEPSSESAGVIVDTQGNPYSHTGNPYHKLKNLINRVLKKIPHGERMMILLTAAVALATIAQAGIAGYSSRSAGKTQTDQFNQMKSVADRMEGAAKSFAGNSANINQGISIATDKLQAQANATEAARQSSEKAATLALQAAINSSRQDQRAWIGVRDFVIINFKPMERTQVQVLIFNSGKTPALEVKGGIRGSDFVPATWDEMRISAEVARESGLIEMKPHPVIPPQGPDRLAVWDPDPISKTDYDNVMNGTKVDYLVGRVEYRDVYHRPQWMTFCLRIIAQSDKPVIVQCETGNDMSFEINK
jgi:hypothetical protein